MHGYGQYCPVAMAAEVLGERWTLLIIRDLLTGAHRFTDLHRGLPGISRTLLAGRLHRLERAGIIERRPTADRRSSGYWLTALGEDLEPAVMAIGAWAARNYGRDPVREELDPYVLMLWIERHVHRDAFGAGRLVVRFDFAGSRPARAWLVVEDRVPTVCRDDPGFEVDLVVAASVRTLHLVFAGRLALAAALRDGSIVLDGSPHERRAFTRWFGQSPFAAAARASLAG